MRGQRRIETFNEAMAAAEARRRRAISEAYRVFDVKHSEGKRLHRSTYMAAYTAWRAIKSTPDADGYEVVRQAFIKASEVADHAEARAELDRAIRAAGDLYEAELARAWGRGTGTGGTAE
jgi:hypothetical protein